MSKAPDLLQDNIGSTLTKLTIPMMLGLISLMLFHLVDAFFIGKIGVKELAALSFSFPITFTFISLSIGLGIGVSAYVAQALGQQRSSDKAHCQNMHISAILLNVGLVSLASLIGYFINDAIFSLLGADDEMLALIRQYMVLWYLAAPFYTMIMTINSLQRAAGNTKFPAKIMALSSILNMLFDPVFIFGTDKLFGFDAIPAMGLQGAAIASLLAWMISWLLCLSYVQKREQWLNGLPSLEQFKFHSQKILKIGLPAAAANMLTPIAGSILLAMVAKYGDAAVAAFGVGNRIESLAILAILALSMTLPPLLSQNYGAKQHLRVKQAIKQTRLFALGWQFLIYLLLILFSNQVAQLFSDNSEVHQLVETLLFILPLAYGALGIVILSASSLNALSRPRYALYVSIIRLLVIAIPFALIGGYLGDFTGILIGIAAGHVVTAIIAIIIVNKVMRKLIKSIDTANT